MRGPVIASNTPWHCVSCYYCTVRCPQEIHITDIMYTLKSMAVAEGQYKETPEPICQSRLLVMLTTMAEALNWGLLPAYICDIAH